MFSGTKKRLLIIIFYTLRIAVTGFVIGNLLCIFSELNRVNKKIDFTFLCLAGVVLGALLIYFLLLRHIEIKNLYKVSGIIVAHLVSATTVMFCNKFWIFAFEGKKVLEGTGLKKIAAESYVMFITYLPINVCLMLIIYIIYVIVKIKKAVKNEA
ncbi:MAG: hypothetical protein K6D02_08415 [Lachnospiraceae bacterium]|nr:hypothetical protein [Lachnospiraceae bacterium]